MEGKFSMTIYDFGIHGDSGPLWRARIWASERLISFNCASEDIRWTILALALRWLAAAWLYGQKRSVLLVRKFAGRDGEAGRFCGWNYRC
jgi:hypothetical protein